LRATLMFREAQVNSGKLCRWGTMKNLPHHQFDEQSHAMP
jgi:hypothetical protein